MNLEIGAAVINGGTTMTIANVDYALDCEDNGNLPCADDGGQMSYLGDANISTTCTDGVNPVTWSTGHPGGTVPNDITFTPSSPVVVDANTTCDLDFDVQILIPSDDSTPNLVEVAYAYLGDCDNDLDTNAGGSAAFLTVEPSILILKEISVDGGATWLDANDPGSAPLVVFPSGALYRLTVENTGNVPIENVVVNDATLGIVDYAVGTLTAGQVVVLTAAQIPQLSVAERCNAVGEFQNVAQVSGDPAAVGAEPVTDEDPAWLACQAGRARFRVIKDFTDDNPAGVEVFLSCNTGLPLDQSKVITEGEENAVTFVVTDFDAGELDCDAFETVPAGYSPTYLAEAGPDGVAGSISDDAEGCHFEEVSSGLFICRITNTPGEVEIKIIKDWVFEGTSGPQDVDLRYRLTLICDAEIVGGSDNCELAFQQEGPVGGSDTWCQTFEGEGPAMFTAEVIPEYPDSHCFVIEEVFDDAVEVDNGCQSITVSAGNGASCTITNTVFFEGIPTLNQYGLALLALLMLGIGFAGFRRFA
jgi:uncharacterized repeat protein (TIGR01451 family)